MPPKGTAGLVALDTDVKFIFRLAFAFVGRIIDSFQALKVTEGTGLGATILAESSENGTDCSVWRL